MGRALENIDTLLNDCLAAGIVFHPSGGQLRPQLTEGRPPEELLERVKANRAEIYHALKDLTAWIDEMTEDAKNDSK